MPKPVTSCRSTGIDHVEFWVGNARQAAAYFRTLWGFTPVAYSGLETGVRDRASYVMRQNDITIVLTAPAQPRRRDRRARPPPRRRREGHCLQRRRRIGLVHRDHVARRPSGSRADRARRRRGRRPPTLVRLHVRRGPPQLRRSVRLPRRLRARLPEGQEAGPRRGGPPAPRDRPLRRQRRPRRYEPLRRLLPRRLWASAS